MARRIEGNSTAAGVNLTAGANAAERRASVLSGRSVEVGASPPARFSRIGQTAPGLRQRVKTLFERARSGGMRQSAFPVSETKSLGSHAANDSARLLNLCLRPGINAPELLETLHATSVIHEHIGRNIKYSSDFKQDLVGKVSDLDARSLTRLNAKMGSREMRNLRGGLELAIRQGTQTQRPPAHREAVRRELEGVCDHLDTLDKAVRAEMRNRGLTSSDTSPKSFSNWRGLGQTHTRIENLCIHALSKLTTNTGQMPPDIRRVIENDFQFLARNAESEIAYAKADDPSTKQLDVSKVFVTDFFRQSLLLKDSPTARTVKVQEGVELGATNVREQISDRMVEYCGGNRDQSRRLTTILTQKSLFYPYMAMRQNLDIPSPYGALQEGGFYNGAETHDFALERQPNGDIRMSAREILHVFAAVTSEGDLLPLDNKKSGIGCQFDVLVPAEKGGVPRMLGDISYNYHLAAAEAWVE